MKIIPIIFVLLITACMGQPIRNDKLAKAITDNNTPIKGDVIEVTPDNFRFDYYDVYEKDTHVQFLTAKGYQGGGPSWAGIVYGAIKLSEPELLDKIRFDEESDGLAIWSGDRKSLKKVGRLFYTVKKDTTILNAAIKVASKNFRME